MNDKIQRLVIEHMYTKDTLFAEEISKLGEKERQEIYDQGLESFKKRLDVGWKLQNYIEKVMYDQKNYDDIEFITEMVTKEWNKHEALQLSDNTVQWYILRLFKSINHRKAYGELCEGDLESYKFFTPDANLFAQYVVRQLFTYDRVQIRFVPTMFEWIYKKYFTDNAKEQYKQVLKKLNLEDPRNKNHDKKPNSLPFVLVPRATIQGKVARVMGLPFIPALEKLYVKHYEESNQQELPSFVIQFMDEFVYKKPVKKREPKQESNEKSENTEKPQVLVTSPAEVTNKQPDVATPKPDVKQASSSKQEHTDIDRIIAQLQQLKQTMAQPVSLEPVAQPAEQNEAQMKLAEEEIGRLRQTIQEQDTQLKAMKNQVHTQLAELLGGARSNYLLSDLYSESMGESKLSRPLIQGQLLNFFNLLGDAMQLEPMSHGYEMGEEFDFPRAELARQFDILSSITGEEDSVRVKLVKYGWSINGQTIVLPQVTELKGVH
ncbi:MAG: hypothetical protein ABS951_00715 [Solibacillus sp.]